MRYLILSFILLSIFACGQKGDYTNSNLTLIPRDQIVDRVKADKFDYRYAKFKNQDGSELNAKEQKMLNDGLFGKDYYEDANGVIQEVIVRPIELEDKLVDIQRREVATKPLNNIQIIEIDCKNLDAIYAEVDSSDQAVRKNRGDIGAVDTKNLQMVISAISACGFTPKHMKTLWMIFQHAPPEVVSYYYQDLVAFSERGNLSKTSLAMLQDKMLMRHGYKQLYGTQLLSQQLYKLEDPDNVNKRRAAMGMGKLENFLKIWNLDFEAEKERLRKEEASAQ